MNQPVVVGRAGGKGSNGLHKRTVTCLQDSKRVVVGQGFSGLRIRMDKSVNTKQQQKEAIARKR